MQRDLFAPAGHDDQPPPPPTIRCYQPEEDRPGPHSTLRTCVEFFLLPEMDEPSEGTLTEIEITLSHWERLTLNPPVGQIARAQVKEFRQSLIEKPFRRGKRKRLRSPATVNKIMRHLSSLITPFWPADRHNPGGQGFLPYFRFPEPLPRPKKLPFTFSLKEMSELYKACDACVPPPYVPPISKHIPLLWRTAIVLAFNTGPRTWDLFSLRWEDIRFDDFQYGSVYYRAQKTAKLQRPPLNRVSRIHLQKVQQLALDPVFVFPGFEKGCAFYNIWRRICKKAGVTEPFESFRKTCSTLHDDVFPGVGAWLLGHSLQGVNAQNYQDPTKRVLRAVYTIAKPVEFKRGAKSLLLAE